MPQFELSQDFANAEACVRSSLVTQMIPKDRWGEACARWGANPEIPYFLLGDSAWVRDDQIEGDVEEVETRRWLCLECGAAWWRPEAEELERCREEDCRSIDVHPLEDVRRWKGDS